MHPDMPLPTLKVQTSGFREQTSPRTGQNDRAHRGKGYADMSLHLLCDVFAKLYCLSIYGFSVKKI